MILAVAATEFEMSPLVQLLAEGEGSNLVDIAAPACRTLITGVGPVETTLRLTRWLEGRDQRIDCVLNFGVAGAYVQESNSAGNAGLLDLCLAEREWLGDFGICHADRIEAFDEQLGGPVSFPLDQSLLSRAETILTRHGQAFRRGNFVTVSAASATQARGRMLAARLGGAGGLCENMEGAAVARVCAEFSLPVLEVRAISNLVEDRDVNRWRLAAACERAAQAALWLVRELEKP